MMVDGGTETKKITIDNFLAAPPALPLGATGTPYTALYLDNSATNGGAIYFDAGTTEFLKSNAAGTDLAIGGFTSLSPSTNDGCALGLSGTAFSDLFLASGSIINFNVGDITLTHSTNLLTLGGGDFTIDAGILKIFATGITGDGALITNFSFDTTERMGATRLNCGSDADRVGLYLYDGTDTYTYIWVDDTGQPRWKAISVPTSNTDGTAM